MYAVGLSMELLSMTVNTRLLHVCVGRSVAVDVVCYNSSGKQVSSLSTVGVGVFAVTYNHLSGLHSEIYVAEFLC